MTGPLPLLDFPVPLTRQRMITLTSLFRLTATMALTFVAPSTTSAADGSPLDNAAIDARSLVSAGDTARLTHVLAKARRGETITVGVMGGSITQGAKASTPEQRYGNRIAAWWQAKFPQAQVKFVNAGIGATGSDFGALRVGRDLLSSPPDFVVLEYAVNDPNTQQAAETLEGLIRQVLRQPRQPAVALLFMMDQRGHNAQEWFTRVGAHYRLPMVSYRDALWPEIEAGRLKWTDLSPDEVHPNDRGHADAARFVTRVLEQAAQAMPADGALAAVAPLPKALLTDRYEHTALLEAAALKPTANTGWSYDAKNQCWSSDQPGSVLECEITGRSLFTMHYVVRGPMGRIKVTVDTQPPVVLEGWFNQTWGGYRQTKEIARNLPPGPHHLRLELLPENSTGSTGHTFRLLGLGAAGTR